jgi:hypothetical protein
MTFGTIFAIMEGIVLLGAIALIWYLVRLAKTSRPQRVQPDELDHSEPAPRSPGGDANDPDC